MRVDLPGRPGCKPRTARLTLRAAAVDIRRPDSRTKGAQADPTLPAGVRLTVVEALALAPPPGIKPAQWRLLTTHTVRSLQDARRITGLYRAR